MPTIERTNPGTFRNPNYGQEVTRTFGQNNRKPFLRPQGKNQPKKPEKPTPVQRPKAPNRQPKGPRRTPSKPISTGQPRLSAYEQMLAEREAQKRLEEARRWQQQKGQRRLNQGFTSPSGKLRRIGQEGAQEAVEQGGKRLGSRIIGGISVLGKIQNAWDLGTGIGGLGRGLLGIDDENPYLDIPGFGAAEFAWNLGNLINNSWSSDLISQDFIEDTRVSFPSEDPAIALADVITSPTDENVINLNDAIHESTTIIPGSLSIFFPSVKQGTFTYLETYSSSSEVRASLVYSKTYDDLALSSSSIVNQPTNTHYSWPAYPISRKLIIEDLEGILVNVYVSSRNPTSTINKQGVEYKNGPTYKSTTTGKSHISYLQYIIIAKRIWGNPWPGNSGDIFPKIFDKTNNHKDINQWEIYQHSINIKLEKNASSSSSYRYIGHPLAHSTESKYNYDAWGVPSYDLSILTGPEAGPIELKINPQKVEKMSMKCLAIDAVKALDARLTALEEKLGTEKLTKITVTKEDGTTEDIDLDGIGGGVGYIAANLGNIESINQKLGTEKLTKITITKEDGTTEDIEIDGIGGGIEYLAKEMMKLEEINQKLGKEKLTKITITKADGTKEDINIDGIGEGVGQAIIRTAKIDQVDAKLGPQINDDTELPWGETLAAAGFAGVGGLAGMALFNQKKLGPEIIKLPEISNGGTPANINFTTTDVDTPGIGGGIDKINRNIQEQKGDDIKRDKLDLRGNLIDLLNLALNLHNAFSLSTALLETIISFMSNVFQMFGLKDKDGNAIDIKEAFGETVEDILKKLIGTEATEDLLNFLKKANRIISTGSNVLFEVQGLTDSVRSIAQQTGEYVAKIGNALRRNRIVPDDAQDSYQWMDEDMRPTSVFQKRIEAISEELQNVTDFMGSLESVTSEVVSAQEQWQSLKDAAGEFKTAVTTNENTKSKEEGLNTAESQFVGDIVFKSEEPEKP
jgi:hypothetical protein